MTGYYNMGNTFKQIWKWMHECKNEANAEKHQLLISSLIKINYESKSQASKNNLLTHLEELQI